MSSEELRDAFHYLYPEELPFLKTMARLLPASPIVVNIGAGAGTSGLAFMESRPDLVLITIDITGPSSPFGCLEAEEIEIKKAGFEWGVRNQQILGDSVKVGLGWQGPKVDMVFIDGNHAYEGCRGDILAWLPHLKPHGLMAVHDYSKKSIPHDPAGPHPAPWQGVDDAVNEFLFGTFAVMGWVKSLIVFDVHDPMEYGIITDLVTEGSKE